VNPAARSAAARGHDPDGAKGVAQIALIEKIGEGLSVALEGMS
jgi:hypothetical protein